MVFDSIKFGTFLIGFEFSWQWFPLLKVTSLPIVILQLLLNVLHSLFLPNVLFPFDLLRIILIFGCFYQRPASSLLNLVKFLADLSFFLVMLESFISFTHL